MSEGASFWHTVQQSGFYEKNCTDFIFKSPEYFCQIEYRAQPRSDALACSGTANLNCKWHRAGAGVQCTGSRRWKLKNLH